MRIESKSVFDSLFDTNAIPQAILCPALSDTLNNEKFKCIASVTRFKTVETSKRTVIFCERTIETSKRTVIFCKRTVKTPKRMIIISERTVETSKLTIIISERTVKTH